MSGVQSICHPFATVIFKIITEQRKGSEHAEQSADSLPLFLFMSFFCLGDFFKEINRTFSHFFCIMHVGLQRGFYIGVS